ncbi:hypothetical protein GOV10_04280 [Candidatus Woesearchaeota archaeon]|nr:hypothetical protein [Candidatus Woesearchaeota archaeon]
MDLREYLEEDMSEFLDTRLSKDRLADRMQGAGSVRSEETAALILGDYEAELFHALKQQDVSRAKQVLHEVKDAFDAYPIGSNERKQLHTLLHSLYSKFRQFLEDENAFNKFEDAIGKVASPEDAANTMDSPRKITPALINELHSPEQLDGLTEKDEEKNLTAAASSVADALAKQGISEPQAHADMEGAAQEFLHHLRALEEALEEEDLEKAHHHYTHAKKLYEDLPENHKRKHRDALMAHHKKITALMQGGNSTSTPTNAIDTSGLERYELEINDALSHKHVHEAMELYETLRSAVAHMSKNERKEWATHLHNLYAKIMSAWEEQKKARQGKTAVHDPTFPEKGSELLEHHEKQLTGKP